MEITADLQIHSKYSRATSKDLSFDNLEKYGRIKGVNLLGTGDFQHPLQRRDIDQFLKEDDKGILWTKTGFPFIWQTEISLMFSQGGKRRAVHLLAFAPNGKVADEIIKFLGSKGRLDYDGRPIFGMSCRDFVEDLKKIDNLIEIIPSHCMTPWFGLFGSDSGFDSLQECFEDQTNKIYAVESGMSADPSMLWRLKEKINIVSFSDSHSFWPWRLGREATVFDIKELTYENIIRTIRTGDGIKYTIETPPEYGKYHFDGHRACNFSCSPEETKKLNNICPICRKQLTIGVDFRIDKLSKAGKDYKPEDAKPFFKILPLHELISFVYNTGMATKKAWNVYNNLMKNFGNELNLLLNVNKEAMIKKEVDEKLMKLILLGREGKLNVKPGYDSVYGVLQLEDSQSKLIA